MFSTSLLELVNYMNLMDRHTKRLNLYISPKTYDQLEKKAFREGRKTGSLARHLLNRWAESRIYHEKNKEEKI